MPHPRSAVMALIASGLSLGCRPTTAGEGAVKGGPESDEGVGCPNLAVSSEGLVFDGVSISGSDTRSVTLSNDCSVGNISADVALVLDGGPGFTVDGPSRVVVAPGESAELTVTFTPASYDAVSGSIGLSEATTGRELEIQLAGSVVTDADGDGDPAVAAGGTDCDDDDPTVWGKAIEDAQDLIDDDCDGTVDEDFVIAGDLLLTEVMVNPAVSEDGTGEWFELFNATDADLDLFGWTLTADDGEEVIVDAHVLAPAGGYLVLGASAEPARNGGVGVDWAYPREDFSLSDARDSIIVSVADRPITAVAWSDAWAVVEGAAVSLDEDFTTSEHADQAAYWCPASAPFGDGDLGTPGAANGRCATVDHDGDGVSVANGDCDDDNPDLSPEHVEVWDGIDNDCDGVVDDQLAGNAAGALSGGQWQALGWNHGLAVVDPNADGVQDLLVASSSAAPVAAAPFYYGAGEAWVLTGSDALAAAGPPSALAWMSVEGSYAYGQRLGTVAPWQGDLDNDGAPDLVIAGQDATGIGNYAGVTLFFADPSRSGALGEADADVRLSGSSSAVDAFRAISHGDYDGDGFDDLVYSNDRASRSASFYSGAAFGFSGADLQRGDDLDLEDDSDLYLYGGNAYAYLGGGLGAGDIDDDGYDDLLVAAPAMSPGGAFYGGSIYILEGSSNPWSTGYVTNLSDWQIDGVTNQGYLGANQWLQVGDFDDDGKNDLLIGAPREGKVYFISDTTALADLEDIGAAASRVFEGGGVLGFGMSVATGDVNGDGDTEVLVGAPDVLSVTQNSNYASTSPGVVYVYEMNSVVGGTIRTTDAAFSLEGADVKDGFGATLIAGDLDGDADDEIIVGAPFSGSDAGGVYIFNP